MAEKILLTADAHYDRRKQKKEQFKLLVKEAKRVRPFKYIFFGGDTFSGDRGRGLSQEHSAKVIDDFLQTLDYFVPGNHELGYCYPWSPDRQGALNEEAIALFESKLNKVFFTVDEDQYKFLVISSDLELVDQSTKDVTDKILKKQKEQREYYQDVLNELSEDQKIVLLLHDPDALKPMFKYLEKHLPKLEKTFAGHHHAMWHRRLLEYSYKLTEKIDTKKLARVLPYSPQYLSANKENWRIWQQCKLITIPAPGGLGGIGGGFLVAHLNPEGLEVQRYNLSSRSGRFVFKRGQ